MTNSEQAKAKALEWFNDQYPPMKRKSRYLDEIKTIRALLKGEIK